MSARMDAIVIGGSAGGLVAATYLARAGRHVLLLEAEESLGGACRASASFAGVRSTFGGDALCALDPRVLNELGLRGLTFAVRDMPLVALQEDGRHVMLGRDMRTTLRAISAASSHDADQYRRLHQETFALARAMRPFWWEACGAPPDFPFQLLSRLAATSAASYVTAIESDALKAALVFDARNPQAAGSALALVWRAAQEMCGLQGAVAMPRGGLAALTEALTAAAQAAGVEIRTRARVGKLLVEGNSVAGVVLDGGEEVPGRAVLSSLPRRKTLLDLAPTASAGFAETQRLMRAAPMSGDAALLFLVNAAPDFGGATAPQAARFIVAGKPDTYSAAASAVREGQLPDDLLLEVQVPSAADPSLVPAGQHLVSVRVVGLPLTPKDGWPALTAKLVEKVLAALERHTTHLRARIVGTDTRMPVEREPESGARFIASYATRIATPIGGLFLCGRAAEPMNEISGRAGRLAVGIANAFLAREKRA